MKVEGIKALEAGLNRRLARVEKGVSAAIGEGVNKIASDAKAFAPTVTGRLDASIVATRPRWKSYRISAAVVASGGHDTPMVADVEYGNRYMAARPFLRPAARRNAGPIRRAIAGAVGRTD